MLVLGLGIGGATTQFTVVNAVVLRGFSFPHPEQLVSVGLIDPKASDQNNNFGVGNIPTAQDYEDLKAGAAFIRNDGRLPQWIDNQRHLQKQSAALHRRLRHGRSFQNHRCVAGHGSGFHSRKTTSRARKRSQFSGTKSGDAISAPIQTLLARAFGLMARPRRSSA